MWCFFFFFSLTGNVTKYIWKFIKKEQKKYLSSFVKPFHKHDQNKIFVRKKTIYFLHKAEWDNFHKKYLQFIWHFFYFLMYMQDCLPYCVCILTLSFYKLFCSYLLDHLQICKCNYGMNSGVWKTSVCNKYTISYKLVTLSYFVRCLQNSSW